MTQVVGRAEIADSASLSVVRGSERLRTHLGGAGDISLRVPLGGGRSGMGHELLEASATGRITPEGDGSRPSRCPRSAAGSGWAACWSPTSAPRPDHAAILPSTVADAVRANNPATSRQTARPRSTRDICRRGRQPEMPTRPAVDRGQGFEQEGRRFSASRRRGRAAPARTTRANHVERPAALGRPAAAICSRRPGPGGSWLRRAFWHSTG